MHSYIYLTREQLYQEVWETSIRGIAQKYNLNYDSLFRKFRDERIPHPSNSYLAKKENGEDVVRNIPSLEGNPSKVIQLLSNNEISPAKFALQDRTKQLQELHLPEALEFLTVYEKENVLKEISVICVHDNIDISPAVSGYVALNHHCFSDSGAKRAEKILSTLIDCLVRLGGKTRSISEQGYYLIYRNTTLQFQMKERTTQHKRSLKELREYPEVPRFEQRFNGKLELSIHGEVFFDKEDYLLEFQLGRILQYIIELSEKVLTEGNNSLLTSQSNEKDFQKILQLYQNADSHNLAKRIRSYVRDTLMDVNNLDDPDIREWAEWALKQADQLDSPPKF